MEEVVVAGDGGVRAGGDCCEVGGEGGAEGGREGRHWGGVGALLLGVVGTTTTTTTTVGN